MCNTTQVQRDMLNFTLRTMEMSVHTLCLLRATWKRRGLLSLPLST